MQSAAQTSPWAGRDVVATFLIPVTAAIQLGTGGIVTNEYHDQGRVNYVNYSFLARPHGEETGLETSIAEEIPHVLNVLKISVSDLARYCGVSRQAIYDWRKGKSISVTNAEKLANFSRAADVIESAHLQMSSITRGRKLPGGMTLFESIASGVDGAKLASALIQMLTDEASQREKLVARFSGRTILDTEGTNDAPTVFNE